MTRKGLLPSLLDTPNSPLPEQAGVTADALKSERFERGLRYGDTLSVLYRVCVLFVTKYI